MHLHIALHRDHSHDDLLGRVSRDLGAAMDWFTGPARSEQDRLHSTLADARNRTYENGVL
jgi:hypothetical protein